MVLVLFKDFLEVKPFGQPYIKIHILHSVGHTDRGTHFLCQLQLDTVAYPPVNMIGNLQFKCLQNHHPPDKRKPVAVWPLAAEISWD